jgi:hypothetical protein
MGMMLRNTILLIRADPEYAGDDIHLSQSSIVPGPRVRVCLSRGSVPARLWEIHRYYVIAGPWPDVLL